MAAWMDLVHQKNPYADFPIANYKLDLQGWDSQSPMFEALVTQHRPTQIIEVGSWKGASAIHMAELMRKSSLVGEILCVDTWLGGVHTWTERHHANFTPMRYGRPTVYEQFIANVIHTGHTDTIVPFPIDSITGAMFAVQKQLTADAIYVDAGHDYEHVMSDLKAWWPIVRPGGIMFGDDYHVVWHGVVRSVHDFAETRGLTVQTRFQDKWLVEKPGSMHGLSNHGRGSPLM